MMDEGPAVGVNVNVAETPALPAARSAEAMVNVTPETALIAPDATEVEIAESTFVLTATV